MPATQSQLGVTKSPYEPGVYFVRGQTWQVIRVSRVKCISRPRSGLSPIFSKEYVSRLEIGMSC